MKTLQLIFRLFPLLLSAAKAVEEAIPLPGQGKKKLDLVLEVLKSAYDAGDELLRSFSWNRLVEIAVPLITKIVALLNELGVFQKSTPETAQ